MDSITYLLEKRDVSRNPVDFSRKKASACSTYRITFLPSMTKRLAVQKSLPTDNLITMKVSAENERTLFSTHVHSGAGNFSWFHRQQGWTWDNHPAWRKELEEWVWACSVILPATARRSSWEKGKLVTNRVDKTSKTTTVMMTGSQPVGRLLERVNVPTLNKSFGSVEDCNSLPRRWKTENFTKIRRIIFVRLQTTKPFWDWKVTTVKSYQKN
jgi:hypothetical protein